jgi:hypothetical protein
MYTGPHIREIHDEADGHVFPNDFEVKFSEVVQFLFSPQA